MAISGVLIGQAAKAQTFSVSTSALNFFASAGAPSPGSQSFTITNTSSNDIFVTYASFNFPWFPFSPGSFILHASGTPGSSGSVTVTPNSTGLEGGDYYDTIVILVGGNSATVSLTLSISGGSFSVSPPSASVTVQSGRKTQVSFTITGDAGALTVTTGGLVSGGSANAPGSFTTTVDATGLSPGGYTGGLRFTCVSRFCSMGQDVVINITVTPAVSTNITVSPPSVAVSIVAGQKGQTPSISIGGGPAAVVITASGQSLSGGSATAPGSFSALVDATNLTPGNYSGTLTFGCTGCASQTVNVTINVQTALSMSVSPPSVSVTVTTGQKTQTPSFTIAGSSTAVQISASGPGLSGGSATSPGSFSASLDATNLTPGTYSGTLTFSCVPTACATQTANVAINVQAPPIQLSASRSSLAFQAYQGRPAPPAQAIALTATGGSDGFNVENVPSWLQVSPSGGTVSSAATPITVTLIPSALTPGANSASINFVSGGSSVSVSVLANLLKLSLSANPAQASVQLAAGKTQNVPLMVMTADGGMVAVAAFATTSKGGPWLKIAATTFNAPGPVPTVTVDSSNLAAGSYSGAITYSCAQLDCGQLNVPITLTVTPALPTISENGVVVASSFGGLESVGPGTYIEIYGSNLATTMSDWSQSFVNNIAPTTLQGVAVKVNGEPAFVDYISPGQINALLPSDLSPGPAQITLTNSLGSSAPFFVSVAPQQPTLLAPFTIAGKQYLGALLPPDYTTTFALPAGAAPGVPSRPAKPGEILVIYALGLGAVTPDVALGMIAPAQTTSLKAQVQILFGQTMVTPVYAGLAAGFVALYQINVQVPQVADGDAVPVTFSVAGTPGAQSLYVAVHQ